MNQDRIKVIFDRVMHEFLLPLLTSRGFVSGSGRLNCHRKSQSDLEYRICAWMKQRPNQNFALVEVTAGVGFLRLWQYLKECDVFAKTEMYTAAGCGGLFTAIFPKDVWPSWSQIAVDSDPDALGREMVDQVERFVFPFLEHYRQLDHALEYWKQSTSFGAMSRIAAIALRGDRNLAFAEFEKRIAEVRATANESQRAGDVERLDDWTQFGAFLQNSKMEHLSIT